jgi:hypothetical protein
VYLYQLQKGRPRSWFIDALQDPDQVIDDFFALGVCAVVDGEDIHVGCGDIDRLDTRDNQRAGWGGLARL